MVDGGGQWTHWLLYNIPPETRALPEGLTPDEDGFLPDGSRHHANSWGNLSYGGPNPPQLQTYRYYIPAFSELLNQQQGDFAAFYRAAKQLATLPVLERREQMNHLRNASIAAISNTSKVSSGAAENLSSKSGI